MIFLKTLGVFSGNIGFAKRHQVFNVVSGIENQSANSRIGHAFINDCDRARTH